LLTGTGTGTSANNIMLSMIPYESMTVLGFDFRFYQKIHRNLIWATRLAGSTAFGPRKMIYYLGGTDNRFVLSDSPNFDYLTEVSTEQNYYYQASATNMRGFFPNVRNGNNFVVLNSELRLPIFKYFMNKPIKSDFISSLQAIAFADFGTAWTGKSPYSQENTFNSKEYIEGPVKVIAINQKDPFVGGYGFGLRSRVWGYFLKLDFAWGVEDAEVVGHQTILSLGLDF